MPFFCTRHSPRDKRHLSILVAIQRATDLQHHHVVHHPKVGELDQGRICGQMQDVSTGKGKSSYYSAMP